MKLKSWRIPVGIVVMVAALVAYRHFAGSEPAEVVKVERRDVVEVVVASGRLRAVRQSGVGAEIAGLVETVEVREGATVKKGQLLGRLRATDVSARLQQQTKTVTAAEQSVRRQEVALDLARRELARNENLAQRKLVSEDALDRSRSAVKDGEAALALSRAQLEEVRADLRRSDPELAKREIRAPFDGLVIARLVEPGQAISISQEWFRIAEMSDTELYVETDENNLGRLRVGQPATAVAPAYPEEPFPAELVQIGPNVDSDRGIVGLRLVPSSLPSFALPNMTVDVSIEVNRIAQADAVPVTAVASDDEGDYVLAVEGSTVRRVPVEVVGRNPGQAAVRGLPGNSVVVRAPGEIADGDRIKPIQRTPSH